MGILWLQKDHNHVPDIVTGGVRLRRDPRCYRGSGSDFATPAIRGVVGVVTVLRLYQCVLDGQCAYNVNGEQPPSSSGGLCCRQEYLQRIVCFRTLTGSHSSPMPPRATSCSVVAKLAKRSYASVASMVFRDGAE